MAFNFVLPSRRIVVFGIGGHGRVVADIFSEWFSRLQSGQQVSFLDDKIKVADENMVVGGRLQLQNPNFLRDHAIIIGVGDNAIRARLSGMVLDANGVLTNAIHPRASIADDVVLGIGIAVMANAVVATGSKIGSYAVVNHNVVIDHDCIVHHGANISSGAVLGGWSSVGENAFVGLNATILPKVRIGNGAIVGAGSVVTKHVAQNTTVIGNPAREVVK